MSKKSYTNKEQGRILADILPLESADMIYAPFEDTNPLVWNGGKTFRKDSVLCWSL